MSRTDVTVNPGSNGVTVQSRDLRPAGTTQKIQFHFRPLDPAIEVGEEVGSECIVSAGTPKYPAGSCTVITDLDELTHADGGPIPHGIITWEWYDKASGEQIDAPGGSGEFQV